MRQKFDDTGQYLTIWLVFTVSLFSVVDSIILTGAPDSYARYPKWAHSFENSLSMELKTRQSDGMLLYTDDGGTHGNFYSLTIVEGHIQLDFRLGDNSNEFGQRRPVNTIRIEEVRIDDDKWHTLTIFQSWENVKLELDYTLVFKILNQRSFVFGNILKNSDVFIGGLPPNMHMLPVMSSPLRRYARHLAVNVRNLMYRQYPQGVTSPQLLESVGTRTNEDDHCKSKSMSSREQFVCLNDGECYSSNDGPHCDCQFSDHDGRNCEIEKNDGELTFGGDEWVGYDVSLNISAAVRAKKENLTLTFKTVHGTSMLFYAGDEKSYLHVMLQDGAIIASSKFDGSDARIIRMFNSFPSQRYDDDSWHTIILERSLQMMTLIVDGRRDEIRQYAPELDWISNSFGFLGSIPKHNPSKEVNRVSFRGCMKKVRYDIDATRILLVNLADQSYGGSVVKTEGDISYSCKNPSQRSDVLSFTETSSYLTLPRWNSLSSGSLSFHFRTTSSDGLILYHGVMQHNATDYVAFELIDSHLFMIINLGSGVVRLQTTSMKVSDGEWHHVQLDRLSRTGSVIVDAIKIDFSTPGVSANLIIDDPIFIGNVPNNSLVYPSSVWSIALQKGYTGCIKNIRMNGVSTKIGQEFEASNSTGIELGCSLSNELDICEPNPCQNFGKCSKNLNSFDCDCSNTNFEGKQCELEQTAVEVNGEESKVHVLAHTKVSQVEHIKIRFRTTSSRGVLFDTGANGKNDKITVFLNDSQLNLFLQDSSTNNTFSWGKSLSDNHWHELQVRRLGQKLLLYLDGFWSHSIYLQNPISVEIDEVGAAFSVHSSAPPPRDEHFKGFLSKLVFNGNDYLAKTKMNSAQLSKSSSRESKGQRNVKTRIASISFTNSTGYVAFSSDKISGLTGSFRVQFKFQTLMRSALLFFTLPKHDYDQSFRLQMLNGRLKYTYRTSGQEFHTTSPKLPHRQHLSDMRWHNVLIYQDEKTHDHVLLVDNSSTTLIIDKIKKVESKMSGKLYFGSNPLGVSRPSNGFRGCISTLRINENALDLYEDADSRMKVNRGCSGPIARCIEDACANHGRCIQLWSSIRCDCSLTAHSGDRCQNPSTTVRFDGSPSAIFYEYAPNERPTTSKDYFVFSFRTTQPNGVLISIECAADQDYFTIFLNKGYLNAHYNLGNRDHTTSYHTRILNDGFPHVIKISRTEANMTIQVDKLPSLRYRPKRASDLVLLNMQTRISIGAAFNTRHLDQKRLLRHRRNTEIFDSYQGEISGVNVNGLMILDLYENGSNRIHTIGAPQTTAVSEQVSSESEEDDELAEMMMAHSIDENPNEALIESLAPSCLSLEEQQSCFIDTDDSTGFFSPVLPTVANFPTTRQTEHIDNEVTALITSSLAPQKTRPKSTPHFTVYPVRPTTPMGDTITTTMQAATVTDFPRTPLIMCSSLAVIIAIAAVVFFVFKCRQNPPNSEHYTMAMKSQSGYTAIAPELSPPMNHDRSNDSCTQPLLAKPHINGNGYEPLKGAVIANGNGATATMMRNGNGNGVAKKKDFKEWYV
ncbi:Neurexin-3-beta [Caenorhabditis elegans]|uniref:Neurexin-3-beta n=1 Tax=Caenorhabditis elegans TaxID=6239 RepID=Q18291_CAEEL|nr:Neurexin-3-beta [Caenorhabditis elegans]CAA98243.3 Neurexin-3-beta [Caenorhabditis elegans]|eukprot:NP_001256262.1 NeuReXin related [Caenorhabditis elegans]